jgi:hypothetical protein
MEIDSRTLTGRGEGMKPGAEEGSQSKGVYIKSQVSPWHQPLQRGRKMTDSIMLQFSRHGNHCRCTVAVSLPTQENQF